MRVLMVTNGLGNGGAERQLTLLAASLPEPWSASVLSLGGDGPFRSVLEERGIDVRVTRRRYRFDVMPAVRVWRAALEIDPDIVHSWDWMSTTAMALFCRVRRIPLLSGAIRHGRLPPGRAFANRLSVSLSDTVVANSRAGLAAYGIAEDNHGRVVYNGLDPARLEVCAAAASDAVPHGHTVAIMAARMVPAKDWRLLLKTARALAMDVSDWKFVAVGAGPERDALMIEAADLVDAGVIEFPEGGTEVLPLIAAADIGLLLTNPLMAAEGCSNSILEYMGCGLPVVCTDSGGNPELVEDGVTGFLVAPQDVAALVSALRVLHDDPASAREMGREGRRHLEARFTVDSMVAGFIAAYESVLKGRGRTRS